MSLGAGRIGRRPGGFVGRIDVATGAISTENVPFAPITSPEDIGTVPVSIAVDPERVAVATASDDGRVVVAAVADCEVVGPA